MDIPVDMGLGMFRLEDKQLVELFGAFTSVFEHRPHRGIGVDVGVFPLQVAFGSRLEGQALINLHQAGVHLANPAPVGPAEDIALCGGGMAVVYQHLFHRILNQFNIRLLTVIQQRFQPVCSFFGKAACGTVIASADALCRPVDAERDFFQVEGNDPSIPFSDSGNHFSSNPISCQSNNLYMHRRFYTISCAIQLN